MAIQNQKIDVQNKIYNKIKNGTFYEVLYDDIEKTALEISDSASVISPKSILVNETLSSFSPSSRTISRYTYRKTTWVFVAIVSFSKEITSLPFEESYIKEPIRIDESIINISQIQYSHPPRKSAEGSELTIEFNILTRS